jgi:hypothetical protein
VRARRPAVDCIRKQESKSSRQIESEIQLEHDARMYRAHTSEGKDQAPRVHHEIPASNNISAAVLQDESAIGALQVRCRPGAVPAAAGRQLQEDGAALVPRLREVP